MNNDPWNVFLDALAQGDLLTMREAMQQMALEAIVAQFRHRRAS